MAYAYTQQHWNAPRFLGFFAALTVNVLLIGGLTSTLSLEDIVAPEPPVVVVPIPPDETVARVPVPQPPGGWDYSAPKPDLGPPPVVDVEYPFDAPYNGPVFDAPVDTDQSGGGPIVTELQVDPAHFVPPMYPRWSVERNEQGVVQLLIYVLADGSVAEVRIAKSSGYSRLDSSAVKTAKAKWRFRPKTLDGKPVAGWGSYAVRFRLE